MMEFKAPEAIMHIKSPIGPFEYHPKAQRVYRVIGTIGEPIATDVKDQGEAIRSVLIYCRGYNFAKQEGALSNGRVDEKGYASRVSPAL
jgi:hypothetical protein